MHKYIINKTQAKFHTTLRGGTGHLKNDVAAGDWPLKVRWSKNLCLIPFAKVNLSFMESNSNQLTSTKMAGCFYDLRL